jgi:hypothetical protein
MGSKTSSSDKQIEGHFFVDIGTIAKYVVGDSLASIGQTLMTN